MGCEFLFSLHKLLHWLVAFLMALLPQHLMAQLSDADFLQVPAYTTTASEPRAAPPVRAVTPPQKATTQASGQAGNGAKRVHLVR
jgi:hypothetical protein